MGKQMSEITINLKNHFLVETGESGDTSYGYIYIYVYINIGTFYTLES